MGARRQHRLDGEAGAVAIIVAVVMVAFLTLAALVIDLGGLYDHDRDLQTAADGGAQAGALELIYSAGSTSAASNIARDYVENRNIPAGNVVLGNLAAWAPAVDTRSVTVDLQEDHVPFLFAPVIGQAEGTVRAHARAEVKYVVGIDKLFPVCINYMNPDHFHFVIKNAAGTEVASFDLGDPNSDGVFDSGGTAYTPGAAGLYTVTMQAIDSDGDVGVELADIGLWRVADPADPAEQLYRVGMYRDMGGGTVTVRVVAAPSVTDGTLSARLGNDGFTLMRQADGTYLGVVAAPTQTTNEGYKTHDLKISKLTGNDPVGRFLALHPDVPLKYVMQLDSFYDGYSGLLGQPADLSANVVTRVLSFGDEYVMKLGNQAGSGLYSGNWRIADIYQGVNTRDEIGYVNPPDTWELYHDLRIGGPLEAEGGAKVGEILNGLSDRFADRQPAFTKEELQTQPLSYIIDNMPADDPYFVIIPIVEFTSLHGTSDPYTIQGFAGFYITDWSKAGDIEGVFIRWAQSGDWQDDKPPGNLYVETAVMTE